MKQDSLKNWPELLRRLLYKSKKQTIIYTYQKSTQIMNPERTKNEDEHSELAYKKLMDQINTSLLQKYPNALKLKDNGEMQMIELQQLEKIMHDENQNSNVAPGKGRGGNNVAQNMKKSVLSILKKRLSPMLLEEYEKRYIKTYELKSQKENFVLYFLFLHQFLFERKISRPLLQVIKAEVVSRIQKYVRNSVLRKEEEPERQDFHEKNLSEFQKFLEIDLDFSRPRSYQEIRRWIKSQYLKKKAVFCQAERKVRKIIQRHPSISKIFTDLSIEMKNQSMLQNSQKSSSNNQQRNLSKSESS